MAHFTPPDGARVTYSRQYRRCGKPTCGHCVPGGRRHGPYWYASWWYGGRKYSRYLGLRDPAIVEGMPTMGWDLHIPESVPLRVRTLGGFAVRRGAEAIPPAAWTSRSAVTLFKCLLTAPSHRMPRAEACRVLWPGWEPEAAAGNLRTTIYRLRRVLDSAHAASSYLRLENGSLVLMPGGDHSSNNEWLDATAFARAARAALSGREASVCQVASALYGGDYLPDDLYSDWTAPTRTALRQQYLDLLSHQAALHAEQGNVEEAENCLRAVLAMEPAQEDAAATLMRLLAAAGRRDAALQVYQTLAVALEDELDVAPTAEVMALGTALLHRREIEQRQVAG